eukprot:GEMP01100767.1.p1 GENE.GEMP01100767.1~~GEMP01100767.1.p1  ORF type:complete len:107 (+),score=3.51 GEMP01100767.1:411-731(+)
MCGTVIIWAEISQNLFIFVDRVRVAFRASLIRITCRVHGVYAHDHVNVKKVAKVDANIARSEQKEPFCIRERVFGLVVARWEYIANICRRCGMVNSGRTDRGKSSG